MLLDATLSQLFVSLPCLLLETWGKSISASRSRELLHVLVSPVVNNSASLFQSVFKSQGFSNTSSTIT